MNRRYWRSMTTVFCIRVDTTTPSRVWPRTDSRPWNGHFGSVHGFSGIGTSIPTSRTVEPTGFGTEAGGAGFFCAFFPAISIHRAFFTRSSGRNRISSPSTSKPPGTSNRKRLPCFGIRFSSPCTSTTSMFRVSSTTRPRTCSWLGSDASTTSTRSPISSCFRRFTITSPLRTERPSRERLPPAPGPFPPTLPLARRSGSCHGRDLDDQLRRRNPFCVRSSRRGGEVLGGRLLDLDFVGQLRPRIHDLDDHSDDAGLQFGRCEPEVHPEVPRLAAVLDVTRLELLRAMPLPRELARDHDEATLRAGFHDPPHGRVAGTSEMPAPLEGVRELLRHDLGVQRRARDLLDFDLRVVEPELLLDRFREALDRAALPADDEPRTFGQEG